MMGLGAPGLTLATFAYDRVLRHLHAPEFSRIEGRDDERVRASPAVYAAVRRILLGIVAFGAVYLRT
jgi:hypothetical protein